MTTTSPSRLHGLAQLTCAGLLGVGSVAGFEPVFGWQAMLPSVLAAVAAGAAPMAVHRRKRGPLRPLSFAAVSAALLLVALLATALRPALEQGSSVVRVLFEGLTSGWARLLSSSFPADPDPELLLIVPVVAWMVTSTTVVLIAWTRARAVLAVPAVAGLAMSLVIGAADGRRPSWPVALLVAGVVGLLAIRRSARRPGATTATRSTRQGPTSPPIPVGALAMGACSIALLMQIPTGMSGQVSAHEAYIPPPARLDGVSPIVNLEGRRRSTPDEVVLKATGPAADWWRLVGYDNYDGTRWSDTGRYTRSGERLPRRFAPLGGRQQVDRSVTIEGQLGGPWLPAPLNPSRLKATSTLRTWVNGRTGAIIGVDNDQEPARTYQVGAADVDLARLATATPVVGDEVAGLTSTPELPEPMRSFAASAMDNAPGWFQQAAALEQAIKTSFTLDPLASPGASLGRLCDILLAKQGSACKPPAPGEAPGGEIGRGGSEQFATLFTLLARSRGLPTRLALGFAGGDIEGGVQAIRFKHVQVRPEVLFDGFGWIPFDPSPTEGTTPPVKRPPTGPPEDGENTEGPTCSTIACLTEAEAGSSSDAGGEGSDGKGDVDGGLSPRDGRGSAWKPLLLLVPLSLLLLPPATILALKARRRRRREGHPDLRLRMLGAWDDLSDRLRERKLTISAGATPTEVIDLVAERPDLADVAPHLAALNKTATRGGWAPAQPDEEEAQQAWTLAREAAAKLREGLGVVQRLRVALSVAPLLSGRERRLWMLSGRPVAIHD